MRPLRNNLLYVRNVRPFTFILHLYYRSFGLVSSLQQLILYLSLTVCLYLCNLFFLSHFPFKKRKAINIYFAFILQVSIYTTGQQFATANSLFVSCSMFIYVACFFCLTFLLRKNLLGSKRKAINIYFAFILQVSIYTTGQQFATANNSLFVSYTMFISM